MTTAQLIIACLTLLGLGAQVGLVLIHRVEREREQRRADGPPPRVGHRVTVHTKKPDDQTLFGVLVGDYTDRITLEDAEYVTPGGGVPIPGRQEIATETIAWIDVHDLVTVPEALTVGAEA